MILVTGGTGLVGTHLLYELCKRGEKVKGLKRETSDLSIVEKVFKHYDQEKAQSYFNSIEWANGDVTDIFSLQEALKGVDKVYHCAAIVSFVPSEMKNMQYINVEGTANVVNASLEAGVKKLLHCSSIAAIGKPEQGNEISESIVWKTSPRNSHYAISKFGAEREVWRGIEEGLDAVIVNPSVIIGPGHPERSTAQIYNQIHKGLKFYTEGSTGFVDVRDVVEAMMWLMESNISKERYVINSENIKYKTVFTMFAEMIGKKPPGIRAGKFLMQLAWRLEKLRSVFSGKNPLITKETVRNASGNSLYLNNKFRDASEFTFMPIEDAVKNTCSFFEKHPLPW